MKSILGISFLVLVSLNISLTTAGTCTGCYTGTSGDCIGTDKVCYPTYPDGTCPSDTTLCKAHYHWKTYQDTQGNCMCQYDATEAPTNYVDQETCCSKGCPKDESYCASNGTETGHWKSYTDTTSGNCMCEYDTQGSASYYSDQESCCSGSCSADKSYCETNGTLFHWKGYTSSGHCMCEYDVTGSATNYEDQSTCCSTFCASKDPGYCATNGTSSTCAWDYKKCDNGTIPCCNTHMSCQSGFCAFKPLVPFSKSSSAMCGDSTTLNTGMVKNSDTLTATEIGKIWSAATAGVTGGAAPGGIETCIQAVSTAIGECGHSEDNTFMTANDPICSRQHSGKGGIWQVTSADQSDYTLAGCSDTTDPCCNARVAYGHAFNQGGATQVPTDYCEKMKDCTLISTDKNGDPLWSGDWNDPSVDQQKPGKSIPQCSADSNAWYAGSSFKMTSITQDQEPCYWGPFAVAGAGGYDWGKEFFPGFYGWGGFFQHYTDSKAGMCDPSPQGNNCNPSGSKYGSYPDYITLAKDACGAVEREMREQQFLSI